MIGPRQNKLTKALNKSGHSRKQKCTNYTVLHLSQRKTDCSIAPLVGHVILCEMHLNQTMIKYNLLPHFKFNLEAVFINISSFILTYLKHKYI